MAVPKKRQSSSRRNKRRANHDKVALVAVVSCTSCGEPRLPHHVCRSCGHYNNREIIAMPDADE